METDQYRIASHVVFRTTTTNLKMLFDREKGVMYELNETASSIIALLHGGPQRRRDLVDALCAEYQASSPDLTEDIERFISDFVSAGLLVHVDGSGS